jgi:hypothetical protein
MLSYQTIFVARDPEIDAIFPGWRRPLEGPVRLEKTHPFTKAPIVVETWDPGHADAPTEPRIWWEAAGRSTGDAQEDRLPAALRALPHLACGGFGIAFFEILVELTEAGSGPDLRYPPRGVAAKLIESIAGLARVASPAHRLAVLDEFGWV